MKQPAAHHLDFAIRNAEEQYQIIATTEDDKTRELAQYVFDGQVLAALRDLAQLFSEEVPA